MQKNSKFTALTAGCALLALVIAATPSVASGATLQPSPVGPGPVPPQYATEYAGVQAELASFATKAGTPPAHASTTLGIELLTANGNIGPGLLRPRAINGVETELNAFQALGIGGVTVDVSFPLLIKSTPDSAAYLRFYEQVAAQIRNRHLVFSVEENPVFSGTPLTPLHISYAGLTLASYAAEERAEAKTIINDLKPDYLSLLTEPDTYTDALHITLDTPSSAVAVVTDELRGLTRHRVKVGAGTGTWSNPSIDKALLAHTSIDYLDVHVYPLGPMMLGNLQTDVAAAKAAHTPLIMDETWLDKPTSGEGLGPVGAPENLKVKSFSFWEPLDETYVAAMTDYVQAKGFKYASFFDGARAFFGYLTWSPSLETASYRSFSEQYNQLVGANMQSLTISGTGDALEHALGR